MSQATIGRWGKNFAIRVPAEIARTLHLNEGEKIDIAIRDDEIVLTRSSLAARRRRDALAAAEEIVADSQGRSLGGLSIKQLIDEDRRG